MADALRPSRIRAARLHLPRDRDRRRPDGTFSAGVKIVLWIAGLAIALGVAFGNLRSGFLIPPSRRTRRDSSCSAPGRSTAAASRRARGRRSYDLHHGEAPINRYSISRGVHDGIVDKDGKPYLNVSAQHLTVNTQTHDFSGHGSIRVVAFTGGLAAPALLVRGHLVERRAPPPDDRRSRQTRVGSGAAADRRRTRLRGEDGGNCTSERSPGAANFKSDPNATPEPFPSLPSDARRDRDICAGAASHAGPRAGRSGFTFPRPRRRRRHDLCRSILQSPPLL